MITLFRIFFLFQQNLLAETTHQERVLLLPKRLFGRISTKEFYLRIFQLDILSSRIYLCWICNQGLLEKNF